MQRTCYGAGSLNRGSHVRKVVVERRHLIGETPSLSNRQATADGEPASLSRAPALTFSNESRGAASATAAASGRV